MIKPTNFSLRELLLFLAICGLLLGWQRERSHLREVIEDYEHREIISSGNWKKRRELAKQLATDPGSNIDKLLYMLSDPDVVSREIAKKALQSIDLSQLASTGSPDVTALLDVYSQD